MIFRMNITKSINYNFKKNGRCKLNKGILSQKKDSNIKSIFIIILIIVFILLVGIIYYSFHLYQIINSDKNNHLIQTKHSLINDGILEDVSEMYDFHDEHSYHIFKGINSEGTEQFVFVSIDDNKEQITVDINDIIPKNQAVEYSVKDCHQCDLVKASPALIGEFLLWEVIYYDEKERYVIDYISMKTGQRIEQLRLISKYN